MLLELKDLGKSFGEHEVLRDVNAAIEKGDRIGMIGANGTGKTTLLRILCGESLPDSGDAAFGTGVTVGYLEQNARLDPDLDIYATMKLVFAPALDALSRMEALQAQLAHTPDDAALTEQIAHGTAVGAAMDAYNLDTQIKKVLNGMGFPAETWQKPAGVLSPEMFAEVDTRGHPREATSLRQKSLRGTRMATLESSATVSAARRCLSAGAPGSAARAPG